MNRLLSIVFPVWALLLTPILCTGGYLLHACECEIEQCCEESEKNHHEGGCGHDSDCPNDPCGAIIASVSKSDQTRSADADNEISTSSFAWADVASPATACVSRDAFDRSDGRSGRIRLACHISDLPLLI